MAALSGRRGQAARNDVTILDAARSVLTADPTAAVSAVAAAAGVGISALYRRYPSKEALLAQLCLDGLNEYLVIAREAQTATDPWEAFATFVRGIVAADVHGLTVKLAGRFMPSDEHRRLAAESGVRAEEILAAAHAAGVVRDDLDPQDLAMIWEQLTAIRLGDADRTAALRRRYVEIHLQGLRASPAPLPESPPTPAELGARWVPRSDTTSAGS
ncbi:TetR/AcrR family transcriptional regulator [Cellulomonas sp. URHE0023]|uniref:TetR/AcrR family transcriptional regulator n=1 Tax=Cellulomonas sp. URHE0023 TaxID=1380354 RepID=UPI0004848B23|nr:TetR family transcriptional regulator [Cellulomonas sp. URHE0023]